jgi:hypothetical protein
MIYLATFVWRRFILFNVFSSLIAALLAIIFVFDALLKKPVVFLNINLSLFSDGITI